MTKPTRPQSVANAEAIAIAVWILSFASLVLEIIFGGHNLPWLVFSISFMWVAWGFRAGMDYVLKKYDL